MSMDLDFDFGENLFVLNFASRMLTAVNDRDTLVHMALETLADFGAAPSVALYLLDGDQGRLALDCVFSGNESSRPEFFAPLAGSPFESVFKAKADAAFALAADSRTPVPAPLPAHGENPDGRRCHVFPILANSGLILGAVALEVAPGREYSVDDLSALRLLMTVLSVSLDNARLFSLAMVDALTGLYMRRFYDVRVQEELDKLEQDGGVMCLVMFDIDHFKRVNDTWGHATGDLVLREFAGLVKDGVRGKGLACRYGGEEFAVIMPNFKADEAASVIDKVRLTTQAKTFPGIEPELRITVSAGIAQAGAGQGKTPLDLFEAADKALYKAKETGRNQVIIAD